MTIKARCTASVDPRNPSYVQDETPDSHDKLAHIRTLALSRANRQDVAERWKRPVDTVLLFI